MLRAGSKRRTRGFDPAVEEAPEAPLSPVVGEPIVFAQPAPDAVVEAPSTSDGRVRCSKRGRNWQCAHMFVPGLTPQGKLQTRCERCRATAIRAFHSDAGKEIHKRRKNNSVGRASKKRSKTSNAGKACAKRYRDSDRGKVSNKRAKTSQAGKVRKHRANTTPSARIGKKICKMCRDGGIDSVSAMEATGCASTVELRAHFESTFEPWMNWANHGAHKAGGNSEAWQTGHRLACAFYDDSNPADIKRCWNKANIFAQDADENHALSVKMPDDTTLERLRALNLLPCAWNGIVPPVAQRAQMERTVCVRVAFR